MAIVGPGGKCADVSGDNIRRNLGAVQLWDCLNGAADRRLTFSGTSLQTLGRCLDIVDNSTAIGTQVQLHDCNGLGGQQWVQLNGSMRNP